MVAEVPVRERTWIPRTALLRDIGVNAVAPYATHLILHAYGLATVPALAFGALFPAAATIFDFVRGGRVQALGLIVLVATAAGIIGALLFTSPYLLLAKGSLVTGLVGTLFLCRWRHADRWFSTLSVARDRTRQDAKDTLDCGRMCRGSAG
jgi:hypothetical protein